MKALTRRLFWGSLSCLALCSSVAAAADDNLDLTTGTATVAGRTSVQFDHVSYNGNFYSALINMNLDGTYVLASAPQDTGNGMVDLTVGSVHIVGPRSFRFLDILVNGQALNATITSAVLGQWTASNVAANFSLASSAIDASATIPSAYTCAGADISLPLNWSGAPAGTQSFAIIMDDPDAQSVAGFTFVHWNVFNVPATVSALNGGASKTAQMPAGAVEGTNHFGNTGYGGPCPPTRHRYYVKVYALNTQLGAVASPITRSAFEAAYANSILGAGQFHADFTP